MNKNRTLWLILDLVFVVVFNIVFFTVGGAGSGASAWISYLFIHLSYAMLVFTPFLVRKSTDTAVLGFPLYSISSTYFIVTFILGVLFIWINPESYKVSLITNVILTGLYVVMLISHMLANESTAASIERHERELFYVKDSSSRIKGIMDSVDDKNLRKQLEKVYDLLHSSPAKSNNFVRGHEMAVMEMIGNLETAVWGNDFTSIPEIVKKIEVKANERNRALKYRA